MRNGLTMQDCEDLIETAEYWQPLNSRCVVCALTLVNGFIVVGRSLTLNPANWNATQAKVKAYENARDQIWPLIMYAEMQKFHDPMPPFSPDYVLGGRKA